MKPSPHTPITKESRPVRTEWGDPFRGKDGKMRMPIGVMASRLDFDDPGCELAQGFARFIHQFNKQQPQQKKKRT
jgi:hypothetical protein